MRTLTTTRLILEPLEVRHAEALFEPFSNTELYHFIPKDPPQSLAELKARFTRLEARRSPNQTEIWLNWVARDIQIDAFVGTIEVTIHPSDAIAQLAYYTFRPFWKKGYAKEATACVVDHLFTDQGIQKVTADIDTRNHASIQLIENLNFLRIKTVENADFFKNATSHEFHYALNAR